MQQYIDMWLKIKDNLYFNDETNDVVNTQVLKDEQDKISQILQSISFDIIKLPDNVDERIIDIVMLKNSQIQGEQLYLENKLTDIKNKLREIYGS